MDATVLAALITAAGGVIVALIALLPRLLDQRHKRSDPQADVAPPSPSPSPPIEPFPAPARGEPGPPVRVVGHHNGESFIRVAGTSASGQASPRELDLAIDGEEIRLHIHQPGGEQRPLWVARNALQQVLGQLPPGGLPGATVEVAGRTARKEAPVVFVLRDNEKVEVQAGWWIWVSQQELRAALDQLGVRVPW